MAEITIFLRVICIALATSVFLTLSFSGYIGWREVDGTVWEFFEFSVLGAGFLPWLTWVFIACYARKGNLTTPLAAGVLILLIHYALFAFLTHSYRSVYIVLQVAESLSTALLIYSLKFSGKSHKF
ncbi:hypothetical protein ALQ60_200278 [Pseudomonas syringae pv. papulans]|nr:hypothetical protein ALO65_200155 [Pseudomonas syringae pv. papulans]RMN41539.1 hypothetical protein ALQ60_200278 [Pseudomonas syringae pv. papulans]RMN56629.1 hypothetical protein ALQ56_200101 [Pseudomonas syringae pv. papulans]RMV47310.1 hypothetical protein ALP11_200082 [Pseudomonas syringae pv. papulans]